MSKFNWIEGGSVTSVPGFRAAGVTAGFKRSGAPDFAMIASDVPANFAGAFTSCTFAAAPVQVCRKRVLESEYLRAAAINSGNANACTGATGIANAERTCELVAVRLGVKPEECLMVGNDATEDLAAREVGMDVFLLTDCLINTKNRDISACPRGDFAALNAYLDETLS